MDSFSVTPRTRVRIRSQRGHYDKQTVFSILDEAFLCHVAFVSDGRPVVIPTAYGREGNSLYLHGSPASRMLSTAASGVDVSIAVTLVDGLVMARSMFHHSINYRSVVVFGHAVPVTDREEKMRALHRFSEHLAPGRWSEARAPNESELDATLVLRLKIEEASAKVRTGPPIDDAEDMPLPVWAGVLPLSMVAGEPQADPKLLEGIEVAPSVRNWRR